MRTLWMVGVASFLISTLTTLLIEIFPPGGSTVLIPNVLTLSRSVNAGIAFGVALPFWLHFVLIPTAFIFVLLLAMRARESPISSTGFGCILGGAFSNIVDRAYDGFVTDFIAVGSFPVFNIADACITVGVLLLLFEQMCSGRR